jgi:hypothetical protein
MSFQLSFHLAPLGATGAHWLDAHLTWDSTQQYAVDDRQLSCKQQLVGRVDLLATAHGRRAAQG